MRRLVCSLVAMFFLVGIVAAAEIKGKIDKIDAPKKKDATLVLKVDDKTQTFVLTYRAKIFDANGKESTGKKRLAILKPGDEVTVTIDKVKVGSEEKDMVTKVQLKK